MNWYNRGNAYLGKKEYDKAIEDQSETILLDPKDSSAYNNRGTAYLSKKEYKKANEDLSKAILLDPKNFSAYNNLAWLKATCPKDDLRDGNKAIEYATKACELTQWKDGCNLATLAAAKAESKNFIEAINLQKKAIKLMDCDKEEAEKARQRLKLYEEGKPYRDEWHCQP